MVTVLHSRVLLRCTSTSRRASTRICRVSGQMLVEPVLLACCRVTMSKCAAMELKEPQRACPTCQCVNFKMLAVPVLDELARAIMSQVPE